MRVLLLGPDPMFARRWRGVFRAREVHAFECRDLGELAKHLRRAGKDVDAIVFDLAFRGGEPCDLVRAVASCSAPCGLVLAAAAPCDLLCDAAARLRTDAVVAQPATEAQMVAALAKARDAAHARRTPENPDGALLDGALALDPGEPEPDLADAILDRCFEVLRAAGLRHPHHLEALRMRALGMTDAGLAESRGVSEGRIRARVGAAMRSIGADDGYALLAILARTLAGHLHSSARERGVPAHALLDEAWRPLADQLNVSASALATTA